MDSVLAVDVGCTTVAAAAAAGEAAPRLLAFEDEDGPAGAFTAALTWTPDGVALVGAPADRALDGAPERGARGPLAHLWSGTDTLELAHGPAPVTALVAALLARCLSEARRADLAPDRSVLAIAPDWPLGGRRARALRAAAALAGLPAVELVPSALAAAQGAAADGAALLLVCDLGGRGCRLSVVGERRLLSTTELPVGADLFDELLYGDVLRALAEHDAATAQRLAELHVRPVIAGDDRDAQTWARCQGELARAVRRCREALATEARATLTIPAPVSLGVDIGRDELADLVETDAQAIAGAAREQLARLRGDAAARIVLVGGGAGTPGVLEALRAATDVPVDLAGDALTAIARGALARDERPTTPPPPPRRAPARAPPPPRPEPRPIVAEVTVAARHGDELVAVVRHDDHRRIVRLGADGRVHAAQGVEGGEVTGLSICAAVTVLVAETSCTLFGAGLRPFATRPRPLLGAAAGATAWIVTAGDGRGAPLSLETFAVDGAQATTVSDEALGVGAPEAVPRQPRRGAARAQPPPPAWTLTSEPALHFDLPALGLSRRPVQAGGTAGPDGLAGPPVLSARPPWVAARSPAATGEALVLRATGGSGGERGWGFGPAQLTRGEATLADWPAGVRVALLRSHGEPDWVLAARQGSWQALRVSGNELSLARAGDGALERAHADGAELLLVCESGGERRLVRIDRGGELAGLLALSAPFEPVGRLGEEIVGLAGALGRPRTLVGLPAG